MADESADRSSIRAVAREREALESVRQLLALAVQIAKVEGLWAWGDGHGGWFHEEVTAAAEALGLSVKPPSSPRKKSLARSLRDAVVARDGLVCGLCSEPVPLSDVHIDHRLPRSLGGTDEIDNLQVAHSRCNIRKGASV